MKITFLISAILVGISCNTVKAEEYELKGTISNPPTKVIYLEKLSHSSITIVDSARLSDKGTFKMRGNIDQLGFYRLNTKPKSNESPIWLLTLAPKEKITCSLDAKTPGIYKITGSELQDDFQNTVSSVNVMQGELSQLTLQYQNISKSSPNSKDLPPLIQLIESKSSNFNTYISGVLNNSKNPLTKYYIYSIFLQQMQGQEIPSELKQQVEKFSDELSKALPKSLYARDFERIVADFKAAKNNQNSANSEDNLAVGKPAPNIELIDEDGKSIQLSSLKGKVVLLDFWASWCGPCRRENPNVVRVYNLYKDKGFVVMSISQDKDLNQWKNAILKDGLIWNTHYADIKVQFKASNIYQVSYIPKTYLINKDGIIVAKDLRGPQLEQEIAKLIP